MLLSGGSRSAGTEACTTSSRGRSSIRRGNPQGSAASRTASTVGDPVTVTDRGADRGSRHRHAPTPTLELRAAIDTLKARGATTIRFLCLLAAPEGIKSFRAHHPDVPVYTASIDRQLNEKGYIVPGLGDAGDRMYGTK